MSGWRSGPMASWIVQGGAYEIEVGRHARDPLAVVARIDLPERTLKAQGTK